MNLDHRVSDLSSGKQRYFEWNRTIPVLQPLSQRHALEVLHREEGRAVRQLVAMESTHDAGVLEARQGARFLEEPGDELWIRGRLRRQDLQRHLLRHVLVHGGEYVTDTAAADPPGQAVWADPVARKIHGYSTSLRH